MVSLKIFGIVKEELSTNCLSNDTHPSSKFIGLSSALHLGIPNANIYKLYKISNQSIKARTKANIFIINCPIKVTNKLYTTACLPLKKKMCE